MAEFPSPETLVAAGRQVREAGYKRIDAFSPFPVEDLSEALGFRDQWVPWLMLLAGIGGCVGGFGFLWWCTAVSYPLNIGGRPLLAWPSWIPITFECTVLASALTGVLGMILLNGLPMPYHPVFDAPGFERASSNSFFLCVEARDPRFDREKTQALLASLGALSVSPVEQRK
jgi:hypothetical protein